jgi:hypothetical protein
VEISRSFLKYHQISNGKKTRSCILIFFLNLLKIRGGGSVLQDALLRTIEFPKQNKKYVFDAKPGSPKPNMMLKIL